MRPIEEFVYVGNQVIVPDQASLMRCYYPIIGGEGYALYQYFVAFYDNGNHRHKFATILNHLNFGMQPLQESLAVLTAVDLLAFYHSPQGIYVVELKSPLSIEQFLKHAVYSSLLEQKIGEPAVDALKPTSLHGLQDLSKRFSDVFTDERLAQKSVSEIKPKNSFDLISFRNRMQADGLVFTDEKTDVPEIYKLSETYDMIVKQEKGRYKDGIPRDRNFNPQRILAGLAGRCCTACIPRGNAEAVPQRRLAG